MAGQQIIVRAGDRRAIAIRLEQTGTPALNLQAADEVYLDLISSAGTETYAASAGSPVFTVDGPTAITINPTLTLWDSADSFGLQFRAEYGPQIFYAPSERADNIIVLKRT